MVDSLNGWIVGQGGLIWSTTDGGENWSVQPTPVTSDLRALWFVDRFRGWAVGDNGVILRTTTGGMLPGDVDSDGGIGISDVALALRFAGGLMIPSDRQMALADVAEPAGLITIEDASTIARAM